MEYRLEEMIKPERGQWRGENKNSRSYVILDLGIWKLKMKWEGIKDELPRFQYKSLNDMENKGGEKKYVVVW